jgi:anti-sigma factor RsiW
VTCREFADFIADYVSGELPADVRLRFEQHLEVCANCTKYLTGYKATVALGRAAFANDDTPAAEIVPDALLKAILSARR